METLRITINKTNVPIKLASSSKRGNSMSPNFEKMKQSLPLFTVVVPGQIEIRDEEESTTSFSSEQSLVIRDANFLRSISTVTQKPFSQIMDFIMDEEWESVNDLLAVNPVLAFACDEERDIETGRKGYHMVCQGETSKCTLLHLILQRCPTSVPLALLERIVKINPSILSTEDMKLGMLPLHLALFEGCSENVIKFLVQKYPRACQTPDGQENLPLHYAAMFSSTLRSSESLSGRVNKFIAGRTPSPSSFLIVLEAYPQASSTFNDRERLPFHLLMSRAYNYDLMNLYEVEACIDAHPECLEIPDRCGRLPLHLACGQSHLRWDILDLLIHRFPAGLLVKDKTRKIPYQLAQKQKEYSIDSADNSGCQDNEVVLQSLSEYTNRERLKSRKGNNLLMSHLISHSLFSGPQLLKKKKKISSAKVDLYNCYG